MIVVDTNVLAYFYIAGPRTPDAEALMSHDCEWAAPRLWRSEFRNVLSGYLRRGTLTFDEICGVQTEAENLFAKREYEVESRRVLELVRDSECTAYDCEFIALAIQLDTQLITLDKKLLKAFPHHAVALASA